MAKVGRASPHPFRRIRDPPHQQGILLTRVVTAQHTHPHFGTQEDWQGFKPPAAPYAPQKNSLSHGLRAIVLLI